MASPTFGSSVRVDRSKFRYEQRKDRGQLPDTFSCGEPELDEFLLKAEAVDYFEDGEGNTALVYLGKDLVAYYTISSDSLRSEYVDMRKVSGSHAKREILQLETYPAMKIGRLAVQKHWQGQGVGRLLVRRIVALAVRSPGAVRFITLNAKPRAASFYEKCGFHLTREVLRERNRINRTMYMDILPLREAILDGGEYAQGP
ncbi:MAG: GNAT family N-acetyltransferase [Euryarchaeota archaeon]|nr:GNAT family N-acetyltransferase [Euryarchaeota archaeon]MDE1837039.1 GNAT family N-acetyltransferase [Euryarchaeota archaeon]MDE1879889.1 GNAT family N-acetyltransferase [Euryarchaeota archaeon]MDE2045697.1 GNAT family N-acetyltransferase [Thermoplasmata archaeon]